MIFSQKNKIVLAILSLAFLASCTTTQGPVKHSEFPAASSNSKAYQYALNQAFSDLENLEKARSPASGDDSILEFEKNFEATKYFEVTVYPKTASLGSQRDSNLKINYGEPAVFRFRRLKLGKCALANELVSAENRKDCVQVEIKPTKNSEQKQFVRIFMDQKYSVSGLSYHEYDSKTEKIKKDRKKIKWDPREPLSSEMLSISKDIVPLDLPVHAFSFLSRSKGELSFSVDPKSGNTKRSCKGEEFKYRNAYGSFVNTQWCLSDPWPSRVETDRYVAVLKNTSYGSAK